MNGKFNPAGVNGTVNKLIDESIDGTVTESIDGTVTETRPPAAGCFHCGEALPPGAPHDRIAGALRHFCCQGCRAVALLIEGSGLENYYRYRTAPAVTAPAAAAGDFTLYDRPAVLERLTRRVDDRRREILLHLDGMRCAACAWLLHSLAARTPGIEALEVNPATARARVEWDTQRLALSALLAAIARFGFKPTPELGGESLAAERREVRRAQLRLAVAGIGMMQVLMYAVGLYFGGASEMPPVVSGGLRWFSLVLSIPVVWFAGWPILAQAWRGLLTGRPVMDQPVALALVLAWSASVWHTVQGAGEVYFEAVTMFVFFLTLARFLELGARRTAAASGRRLAEAAVVGAERCDPAGTWTTVTADELETGDRVRLQAAATVPADIVIENGEVAVDESLLTGEAVPRLAGCGRYLLAGSRVVSGTAEGRVAAAGEHSSLGRLRRILSKAQSSRPLRQAAGDRLAAGFIGLVLLLALGTAVVWWHMDPARAFAATLAVLVVTCPCALSLAAPAALAGAIGALARRGIFIAGAAALDKLASCDLVLLDKTGTLTDGRFSLIGIETSPAIDRAAAIGIAAALMAGTRHPLATAFGGIPVTESAGARETVPGAGVTAQIGGRWWRLGRADYAGHDGDQWDADIDGHTLLYLGDGRHIVARFRLADRLRADAADAVRRLERLGLMVRILSGDRPAAVKAAATRLGIADWRGGLLPEDKMAIAREAQRQGHTVAMAGDGVNDAPVLAAADVSIALAGGEAIGRAGADVIITAERLAQLPELLAHAHRTRRIIRQNFAWAVAYNLLAAPAASLGFVAPWLAALGMSLSSLVVVGNALRAARLPMAETSCEQHTLGGETLHGAAAG